MDCADHTLITVDASDLEAKESLLRIKSRPVMSADQIDVASVVASLRNALAQIEYGAGLAAIQLGIPFRIAVVNIERTAESELVLINPILISTTGRLARRQEGCLSLPSYKGGVIRRNKIEVQYQDMNGHTALFKTAGYKAAVIQHELDHMEGILFWDRLGPCERLRRV